MKKIKIFTDGSCIINPGPGGYGVIIYYNKHKKILSKGYFYTTNNRMELISAIKGLEYFKIPCKITLITDSQYLYYGITKWIKQWKKNKWKKKNKKLILNIDLWKKLDTINTYHKITWKWIKSHSGNLENEKCDKIAYKAALHPTKKDNGYIKKNL